MRIFVSWSGPASHTAALLIHKWLKRVLQYSEPFVSSTDIAKGSQWLVEISEQLTDTVEGIVCVTPSNVGAPWLNYEAGALAKTTGQTAVRPVLLGLKPSDIPSGMPLANFQHTDLLNKDEMWSLIESIHLRSPAKDSSAPDTVRWAFDMAWPDLESKLSAIDTNAEPATTAPESRDEKTLIQELLGEVRELSLAVANLTASGQNHVPSGTPVGSSEDGLRRATVQNPQSLVSSVRPGMLIEHPTFGVGPVADVEGSGDKKVASVDFVRGRKRLLLRYAPFSILPDDELPF
ncbi:hypothetical protein QF015_002165 [Paenarthrobacter sp. TE4293]|uniref:TIR domain-containing protein n=1 Tax=Paenarthrobacter sp. TE4293 TaxID=3381695 RepID=UPI003D21CD7D